LNKTENIQNIAFQELNKTAKSQEIAIQESGEVLNASKGVALS
jgi:hypothetical protein